MNAFPLLARLPEAPSLAAALRSSLPPEVQHALCRASELERRLRDRLRQDPLATGLTLLDRLLGGGLPRGALVELVGRGSCGRLAILLAALGGVSAAGELVALVDLGSQLDPRAARAAGVALERLLWLRPSRPSDALAAAEILVHTGFPLVAVDLGLPPLRGKAPVAAWLRLARSASAHGAAVLVSSPYRLSGCAATAVVTASQGRGNWSQRARTGRLLHGLTIRLTAVRRRGNRLPAATDQAVLPVSDAVTDPVSAGRPTHGLADSTARTQTG